MPSRIKLERTKGWRMPEGAIKVDRRTRWGNPFDLRHGDHCWTAIAQGFKGDTAGRQAASVAMYRAWVLNGQPVTVDGCGLYCDTPATRTEAGGGRVERIAIATSPEIHAPAPPTLDEIRTHLRGKTLACWCKLPEPGQPDICHAAVLLEWANR